MFIAYETFKKVGLEFPIPNATIMLNVEMKNSSRNREEIENWRISEGEVRF